jgi:excinuclease ABC subunit C
VPTTPASAANADKKLKQYVFHKVTEEQLPVLLGDLNADGAVSVKYETDGPGTYTASKIAERARLAYMSPVNDTTTDIPPANALKGAALIKDEVSRLPDAPGVYRMIGENEEVLYVGKAKSLKKRVVQYAQGRFHTNRIAHMVDATRSMEFVTTRTEADALLLEINLIKQLKPRFNVLLRDDKSFPEIVIRRDHDAPQLRKHRGAHTIKGDYFGPFASAWAVNRTLNTLQKAFLLRSCSDSVYETRDRPCMLHQIKRCAAPCTGLIGKDDYQALVDQAEAFLRGKSRAVMATMAKAMEAAAEDLEFERAARLRDRIRALSSVAQESQINPETVDEADVVALHVEGGQACVQVFFFRAGQNWGNRAYFPRVTGNADESERTRDHRGAADHDRLPGPVLRRQADPAPDPDQSGARRPRACWPRPSA